MNERVVDRGSIIALEEGTCTHDVEAFHQPNACLAIVIVRVVAHARRIETGNLPRTHHALLERNIIGVARERDVPRDVRDGIGVTILHLVAADLVTQNGIACQGRNRAGPPLFGANRCVLMVIGKRRDMRVRPAFATRAFRPCLTVSRVVDTKVVDIKLVPNLHPQVVRRPRPA